MTRLIWDELRIWWHQNVICDHPGWRAVIDHHDVRTCKACGKQWRMK